MKWLASVAAALNGEVSPRQIAAGFAWGVVLGLLPLMGLLPTLLFFLAFLVNINLAIMGVAAGVFKLIAFLLDPLADKIGLSVLQAPSLRSFWTTLYNAPVVPYTQFNNTLVMGSLIIGLLLLVPMYFIAKAGVVRYRTQWRDAVSKSRLMQVIKASTFYKYYAAYQGLRGE